MFNVSYRIQAFSLLWLSLRSDPSAFLSCTGSGVIMLRTFLRHLLLQLHQPLVAVRTLEHGLGVEGLDGQPRAIGLISSILRYLRTLSVGLRPVVRHCRRARRPEWSGDVEWSGMEFASKRLIELARCVKLREQVCVNLGGWGSLTRVVRGPASSKTPAHFRSRIQAVQQSHSKPLKRVASPIRQYEFQLRAALSAPHTHHLRLRVTARATHARGSHMAVGWERAAAAAAAGRCLSDDVVVVP